MICFLGSSHAAQHLAEAAVLKCIEVTDDPKNAALLFVSEDTPTAAGGVRNLEPIGRLVAYAALHGKPIVLTSQVTPGYTRALGLPHIYHQAETLRIKDAKERALAPDYIAVGCCTYQSYGLLPAAYRQYLEAFTCPVEMVTWEDAEFSKIAVNMTLAAQVESANELAAAAGKVNASWWHVSRILAKDKRIGEHSYLKPGRWQDSQHLLRDYVTLQEINAR